MIHRNFLHISPKITTCSKYQWVKEKLNKETTEKKMKKLAKSLSENFEFRKKIALIPLKSGRSSESMPFMNFYSFHLNSVYYTAHAHTLHYTILYISLQIYKLTYIHM